MGFLAKMGPTITARRNASMIEDHINAFWSGAPMEWTAALSAAGVPITPDLALTLTAMSSGVRMIAMDLATCTCEVFRNRMDGGKDRIRPIFGTGITDSAGVGSLAYMLRWQPNDVQTAVEYTQSQVAQYLLRGVAYAEILDGPAGFLAQLLPRHPDRITPERLPSGRVRYKLREFTGEPRYVTQDEMHVVRDIAFDAINPVSRIRYASQSLGTAIATQAAAGKFFKSGMTASTVATYTGGQDAEYEATLHGSISRYATGVDNSFGLLLIPDDVKISNLAVDPDKAQMMVAQEWGVREVARALNLSPGKLGVKDASAYASQVQEALDYILTTLRPIAVLFEQAIQRDLILAKDTYLVEYKLQSLMRGDFEQQAKYYETFIRSRVMRPSEVRLELNLNPDPALDKLSEGDMRPGASGNTKPGQPSFPNQNQPDQQDKSAAVFQRVNRRRLMLVYSQAQELVRHERAHIERMAAEHADDPDGWKQELRDFYAEHAGRVSQKMRVPIDVALAYAAQHGSAFEVAGTELIEGDRGAAWEQNEADDLAALSLYDAESVNAAMYEPTMVTTREVVRDPVTQRITRLVETTQAVNHA